VIELREFTAGQAGLGAILVLPGVQIQAQLPGFTGVILVVGKILPRASVTEKSSKCTSSTTRSSPSSR